MKRREREGWGNFFTHLDAFVVVLTSGHFRVLRRWLGGSRWRFLIPRRPVELPVLGRIDVRIVPMPVIIGQLAIGQIGLGSVQLVIGRRDRLLLLLRVLGRARRLLLENTGGVRRLVPLCPFFHFVLPSSSSSSSLRLAVFRRLFLRRGPIDLVEGQLLFALTLLHRDTAMRLRVDVLRSGNWRIDLIEGQLAGILRLGPRLVARMVLSLGLRVTPRVPLIDLPSRDLLMPRGRQSRQPLARPQPDRVPPVLQILVPVLEHLPRLVLLLELGVVVRVEPHLIEISAQIGRVVVGGRDGLHVYLEEEEKRCSGEEASRGKDRKTKGGRAGRQLERRGAGKGARRKGKGSRGRPRRP